MTLADFEQEIQALHQIERERREAMEAVANVWESRRRQMDRMGAYDLVLHDGRRLVFLAAKQEPGGDYLLTCATMTKAGKRRKNGGGAVEKVLLSQVKRFEKLT